MSNVANIVHNGIAGPVYLVDQSGNALISTASGDAQNVGILGVGPYLFNGASADLQRSNIDFTAIAVTASTTTQASVDLTNYNGRGVKIVLNVSSAGTGSITLSIRGKDFASGAYYTILTGAAVTTTSTNVYTVYPGITATANVSASDILPRTWDVLVTANNSNATTYTVGASIIL